jgi:hypothetical protein
MTSFCTLTGQPTMFARLDDWSIVDEMLTYDWSALDEMIAMIGPVLDEMFADLNDWSTLTLRTRRA